MSTYPLDVTVGITALSTKAQNNMQAVRQDTYTSQASLCHNDPSTHHMHPHPTHPSIQRCQCARAPFCKHAGYHTLRCGMNVHTQHSTRPHRCSPHHGALKLHSPQQAISCTKLRHAMPQFDVAPPHVQPTYTTSCLARLINKRFMINHNSIVSLEHCNHKYPPV